MATEYAPPMIPALQAIASRYSALFCDVWGVLHNGVQAFPAASSALQTARDAGVAVVLITNSPRLSRDVEQQLAALGVPRVAYDAIVTSGDVTRGLIAEGPRRVFHIGAERDLTIYEGLDIELVEEFEADGVVCTGLVDDATEQPDQYADLLRRLRARNLPMICANPDIVVERGEALIWCAGALARDYALLGGRTAIAGKPHSPIYRAAMEAASALCGSDLDRSAVLAIGDGMLTDVKGAADFGLDVLYISAGVHARDYGPSHAPDLPKLTEFLAKHGAEPVGVLPYLR